MDGHVSSCGFIYTGYRPLSSMSCMEGMTTYNNTCLRTTIQQRRYAAMRPSTKAVVGGGIIIGVGKDARTRARTRAGTVRVGWRCAAKGKGRAPSGGRRGSNKRKNNDGSSLSSSSSSSSSSPDDNNAKSSIPAGDLELTALFEEDIKSGSRLQPGADGEDGDRSSAMGKSVDEKIEEIIKPTKKGRAQRDRERKQQEEKEFKPEKIAKKLGETIPKSRNDTLQLLVRGAWIGIGALVALFVSVHLFVVGDWVGKS